MAQNSEKGEVTRMTSFKQHYKSLLLNPKTEHQFVNAIFDNIRQNRNRETNDLLDLIDEEGKKQLLLRHLTDQETVLHAAVKAQATSDVISRLIDVSPFLLVQAREGSQTYKGQTALHIAITQGNLNIIELILSKVEILGKEKKWTLLHQRATGSKFINTVMMGELPLTVAALTLKTTITDLLQRHGANLTERNSYGDNMCHSLIKYAHLYPEKVSEVMKMFEHISKLSTFNFADKAGVNDIDCISRTDLEKRHLQIWLMENSQGLNPLKLSADLGQYLIFKHIMELKGIYCYINSEDGLFDVEMYDVTDIDPVSELKFSDVIPLDIDISNPVSKKKLKQQRASKTNMPIFEMIFKNEASTVFKFIQLSPLRYVINRKWEFYKWFYLAWGILHVLYMVGYTVYAIERSKLPRTAFKGPLSGNYINQIGESTFITFYLVLSIVIASIYLLQELVRMVKHKMPWTWSHVMDCYHNGPFRLVLVLFSICVIVDFIWRMTDVNYENYILVCAMILGWWFLVFFLRGVRQFSFFTVMIQKVLVGDMFRFSIIIGMELVAFTTGMYIAFQGAKTTDDVVEHYGKLIVLMFKMMFGFTSMDVLFEARQTWFAVCIYTAFVLLTYVLMINSLIAMMSNTCSVVSQNREIQWRVQQLSIVLFFESFLPSCCLRYVGKQRESEWYDASTQRYIKKQRYFMEVRSLMEVSRSKSRLHLSPETMIESIFNTIRDIRLPGLGVFENEENEPKKKSDTNFETAREVRNTPDKDEPIRNQPMTRAVRSIPDKDKLVRNQPTAREVRISPDQCEFVGSQPKDNNDKESIGKTSKEKKKRKKKKKMTIEPEVDSGEWESSRLTEVEYLSPNIISPDPDGEMPLERSAINRSNFPTLEIHNL